MFVTPGLTLYSNGENYFLLLFSERPILKCILENQLAQLNLLRLQLYDCEGSFCQPCSEYMGL